MSHEPFDRTFLDTDDSVFLNLVGEVIGERCAAWRKGYGRSGSFHFGPLIPMEVAHPGAVDRDRGTWVLNIWDCQNRLTLPNGAIIDSTTHSEYEMSNAFRKTEGLLLKALQLDSSTLSLEIAFSGEVTLRLIVDSHGKSSADEQWAVELPDGRAVLVYGDRRWVLEES